MDMAYKVIFGVGVLYTFVSFIISGLAGALDIGHGGSTHTHLGGHGDVHGHGLGHSTDTSGGIDGSISHDPGITHTVLSWFSILINPIVAVSFLTVFGGLGILGTDYYKWVAPLVFIVSLFSGSIVAFILYKFVATPLYKSENSTDVSKKDLVNTTAEVISPIIKNGYGQIKYTVNSIRYTAPAMHIGGDSVAQGQRVIIYKIENGVFYIVEIDEE